MATEAVRTIGENDNLVARSHSHGAIAALTDTDAAYIAGMIDADGSITVSAQDGRVKPLVCVFNSNVPLIDWLSVTIGAGCSYRYKSGAKRPDQDGARWNPVHRYQITGRKAQSLLTQLLPHLRVKRAQAELVLSVPMRGRDFGRAATAEQRAAAADVLGRIRVMNARGVKVEASNDG
ncbi:MAG: hypothetical protein ACK4Z5_02745 [Brevundimonas sp.]